MGRYYHSFRENADLKLFVKSLLEAIFGKLIFERENWLNHLENSQELQFIYSKAFSVSLPHIARTLYFRRVAIVTILTRLAKTLSCNRFRNPFSALLFSSLASKNSMLFQIFDNAQIFNLSSFTLSQVSNCSCDRP